jgi:hypothetical protein
MTLQKRNQTEEEFTNLFRVAESAFMMSDLPPNLKAEHVHGRVKVLVSREVDDLLPVLLEILFYRHKGYLNDTVTVDSFVSLLGKTEGETLLNGSTQAKREVLQQFLPNQEEDARWESLFAKLRATQRLHAVCRPMLDEQRRCAEALGRRIGETNSIGMDLMLIPPSEFMMGADQPPEVVGRNHRAAENKVDRYVVRKV